jgi:spore maturation protein CgeB
MPDTALQARSKGARVFVFHADNPLPPWGANRPETLSLALASDVYLIWSRQLAKRLADAGVKRVEYLPFAWDPVVFPHIGLSAAPTHSVVFVGGWDKEREEWLTPLAERFDLKIWGPAYWGERTRLGSPLRRCWQGAAVEGPKAAQTLADAAVALNPVRQQNLPDGMNMRTFEVPGCGGFALSTRTAGAQAILPEGSASIYFDDLAECFDRIEHFLARPTERLALARMAHAHIAEGHQYTHRARTVLDLFDSV